MDQGIWADLREDLIAGLIATLSGILWNYTGEESSICAISDEFQSLSDLFIFQNDVLNLNYKVINRSRVQSVDLYLSTPQETILIQDNLLPEVSTWQVQTPPLVEGGRLLVHLNLTSGSSLNFYSKKDIM